MFRRDEVLRLRAEDMSWRKIAEVLDVPMSTVIDSFRQSADSGVIAKALSVHTLARNRAERQIVEHTQEPAKTHAKHLIKH